MWDEQSCWLASFHFPPNIHFRLSSFLQFLHNCSNFLPEIKLEIVPAGISAGEAFILFSCDMVVVRLLRLWLRPRRQVTCLRLLFYFSIISAILEHFCCFAGFLGCLKAKEQRLNLFLSDPFPCLLLLKLFLYLFYIFYIFFFI